MRTKVWDTIFLVAILAVMPSCRAIFYNVPDVTDHKIFPYRVVLNDPGSEFHFERPGSGIELGKTIRMYRSPAQLTTVSLDDYLEISKTAAFLIIRNDTILYENYCRGYDEASVFNIFSVTKAFVTTLIGIALDEGLITSLDQPVTDYIPELSEEDGFGDISIRHLLLHTSGIKFNDSWINPFGDQARYYYGRHLRRMALNSKVKDPPGKDGFYSSVNLQLLAILLERATGATISEYLEEKVWQRIGMQYEATWSLDSKRGDSMEKAFACLNCRAIDLAKLGRLYLHGGKWGDEKILSSEFINEATRWDTTGGSSFRFQYNIRLGPKLYGTYYALGLYGQLVYLCPGQGVIMVRIGESDLRIPPRFTTSNMIHIIDQL